MYYLYFQALIIFPLIYFLRHTFSSILCLKGRQGKRQGECEQYQTIEHFSNRDWKEIDKEFCRRIGGVDSMNPVVREKPLTRGRPVSLWVSFAPWSAWNIAWNIARNIVWNIARNIAWNVASERRMCCPLLQPFLPGSCRKYCPTLDCLHKNFFFSWILLQIINVKTACCAVSPVVVLYKI